MHMHPAGNHEPKQSTSPDQGHNKTLRKKKPGECVTLEKREGVAPCNVIWLRKVLGQFCACATSTWPAVYRARPGCSSSTLFADAKEEGSSSLSLQEQKL